MQKGFIFNSLYIALGCAAVITLISGYAYIQTKRLEACKSEFQVFKSEVERLGLEAKAKVKQQEAQDKLKKEAADNELKKLRLANTDLSKRLRDNAGSSFLSREAPAAGSPDLTCFNSAELDGALRDFAKRSAELVIEGTENTLRLKSAVEWANK